MAQFEEVLWTGLIQREWRKEYYCPDGLTVTTEEFASELSEALQTDNVPAEVGIGTVNWDGTGTIQTRILIAYTGSEESANTIGYLVGIDQMGNYSYVEGKTFFLPPDLPREPRETKEVPASHSGAAAVVWLFSHFMLWVTYALDAPGVCIGTMVLMALLSWGGIVLAIREDNERTKARKWNQAAALEASARRGAWTRWQERILASAYLSRTEGTLARFVQAVSSTIDQVSHRLFVERNAELRSESERQRTREEIEEKLEQRRAEAFS